MIQQRNKPSSAPGPSLPFTAELHAVWDVLAEATYETTRSDELRHHIAIRTHAGAGELQLEGKRTMQLKANSLIIVEGQRIQRYRCSASSWEFWWFEFTPAALLPYALNTIYTTSGEPQDDTDFEQVFTKLQHHAYPVRCVASATFSTMLQRWLADARQTREQTPHRDVVETMIARIHHNVAAAWSGPRLAHDAGLCESTFRTAFKQATGTTPARFVRTARLQAAYQMCQQRVYTLATIAEQLNFSSPFHLSTAFKKEFGVNPSEV